MIVVVANVRARADRVDELVAMLRVLVEKTRREAGCVSYDLHVNSTDPQEYLFYERWRSAADLNAHLNSPHFIEVASQTAEICESAPVILQYALVE